MLQNHMLSICYRFFRKSQWFTYFAESHITKQNAYKCNFSRILQRTRQKFAEFVLNFAEENRTKAATLFVFPLNCFFLGTLYVFLMVLLNDAAPPPADRVHGPLDGRGIHHVLGVLQRFLGRQNSRNDRRYVLEGKTKAERGLGDGLFATLGQGRGE